MNSATKEARYHWMCTGRKPSLITANTTFTAGVGRHRDSWEEQAFSDDASGHLGGCVWPPRSYSCSFCRREFRSAQALGGHMNVHRRDRARLKQSPMGQALQESISSSSSVLHHYDHLQQSTHLHYPNQSYPTNIRSVALASSLPAVDSTTALLLQVSPSINSSSAIHGRRKRSSFPQEDENLKSTGRIYLDERIKDTDVCKNQRSLNLPCSESKSSILQHRRLKSLQVLELEHDGPLEELDLELRLGDRSEV